MIFLVFNTVSKCRLRVPSACHLSLSLCHRVFSFLAIDKQRCGCPAPGSRIHTYTHTHSKISSDRRRSYVSVGNTEGPAMLTLSERDRQISNRLFLTEELLLYSCVTLYVCVCVCARVYTNVDVLNIKIKKTLINQHSNKTYFKRFFFSLSNVRITIFGSP